MIPGNYWLSAARDFYSFQEYGRMEDIPTADIATHPFLLALADECIERAARLINADKDMVISWFSDWSGVLGTGPLASHRRLPGRQAQAHP